MDPLIIDIELASEDWDALDQYTARRLRQKTSRRDYLLNALLAAVPAIIIVLGLRLLLVRLPLVGVLGGFVIAAVCVVFLLRRMRFAHRHPPGTALARVRLEFDARGVRAQRALQSSFTDWRMIERIDETADHVFLPLDQRIAYVIPKRLIASISPEAFATQLRAWHAQCHAPGMVDTAGAASADGVSSAPAPTDGSPSTTAIAITRADHPELATTSAAPRGFWLALRANLVAGLRALMFRRVLRTEFEVTFEQLAALLGIALVIAAVFDRLGAGPDDELVAANVYTWSAILLMGLWTCAVIARVSKPRVETRVLLVVALSIAPWALIVACLCSFVPAFTTETGGLLAVIAVLIIIWASTRTVRAVYGFPNVSALIVLVAALLLVAVADDFLDLDPHLWEQVAADDDESTGWQDAESTFYDQPGFIDESLQKLAPQRPGITDLYYVAFAGDGDQRVFRREALFGEKVFAERMGTGARSLELVNDRETRTDFPLATATGLRYSLSQLAMQMDPKEDVLVLFLTSHGSRESGIYVHTGVTPIDNDLPPSEVRSALDDAGIRWRIVIVSACYSGTFVEPLKSDTTMIITASDSLNTSFGCADDRDLTYFGEAFLRDSLPKAPSLEAAFERARKEIAERETEEKLTPSNPQMWVGASMSRKLAQLGPLPLAAAIPTSSAK